MLKRVGNTRSLINLDEVIGTSDDGSTLIVLFRGGGQIVFDGKERDEAWLLLWPDKPPKKGNWQGK